MSYIMVMLVLPLMRLWAKCSASRLKASKYPVGSQQTQEELEQKKMLNWLKKNKALIVSDILKGRGKFIAEWMLVAQKDNKNSRWILKPMNFCMNHFGNGEVEITKRGNFKIGAITMQRKGGDAGRPTVNMLQFKINPAELFEV